MFMYRVTKYDPVLRSIDGAYTKADWTSFSDIGQRFNDITLTFEEYKRVESSYISVAGAFLREASQKTLSIRALENHAAHSIKRKVNLTITEAEAIIGSVLREEFWCKLEAANSYVHIGYDYYMYIGVPKKCPLAIKFAKTKGLFVELFKSPYLQ